MSQIIVGALQAEDEHVTSSEKIWWRGETDVRTIKEANMNELTVDCVWFGVRKREGVHIDPALMIQVIWWCYYDNSIFFLKQKFYILLVSLFFN